MSTVNGSLDDGLDGDDDKSPDVKSPVRVQLFLKLWTNSCGNIVLEIIISFSLCIWSPKINYFNLQFW